MIDFVAVSYVRCAHDIHAANAALDGIGLGGVGVAAEINTAAALGRFADILNESNAVILNRWGWSVGCVCVWGCFWVGSLGLGGLGVGALEVVEFHCVRAATPFMAALQTQPP